MGLFRQKKRREDHVIDLRPSAAAAWGSPVPCPTCAGRGYVDHIDPFREVMFLHCTECEAKYERTRSPYARAASTDAVKP